MQQKIALVDDDQNILTSVSMALEAEGYDVDTYADGVAALSGIGRHPVDLAVLDIKMPKMDGMELLGEIRKKDRLPVIFLTSKDDEVDEILGFRMGADDYITKPFSQRLLIERIRAILRRRDVAEPDAPADEGANALKRGDLVLDPERHLCTWKGQEVTLTVAYDDQVYVDDRTIDSHIKRLRRKFRHVDPTFSEIETLYGVGYRYKA